jgi:hypothetical protein
VTFKRVRSKLTGLLTCGAAITAFVCLRFAASVLLEMLERTAGEYAELPRLAAFALTLTCPWILVPLLLLCVVAVVVSEATLESEANRLLVQAAVLLLLVVLLAMALAGFFIPFYIPDVRIE